MTVKQLTDAFFDQDLRSVHYFNGRLLSAEDLSAEQAYNQEERKALGRAIGHGIVHGLEVRKVTTTPTTSPSAPARPIVSVRAGLALNRDGQTLRLEHDTELSLSRPAVQTSTEGAMFSQCDDLPDSDTYVAGAGLYLLTLFPVEGHQGRAYASGLNNTIAACNTKYRVKGVRFRLIQLDLPPTDLNQPNLLRNRVAYRCFGTDTPQVQGMFANLFGTPVTEYGLLDDLRPNVLTDCDVPLAVLYWTTSGGLVFVDTWSVRRRVTPPTANSERWLMTSDRRASEGEAIFMQFQEHISDFSLAGTITSAVKARDYFRYLPSAGILPLSAPSRVNGFDAEQFFDGITTRASVSEDGSPIVIEGARVEALLRASFTYPPFDLTTGVMLWIYQVRENMQSTAQPYLIFASGHMPYIGDAHYDVNRYNFGVFA